MKTLLEFDYKKAVQALNYLAELEGGKIDKLKAIKLVYFADRYHLRKYGRPIINDTYLAMPFGPVGSTVKDITEFSAFLAQEELKYAKKYLKPQLKNHLIYSIKNSDKDVFSDSDMEALNFSFSEFGKFAPITLAKKSHIYPEWLRFKSALDRKEITREFMNYSDFFQNPPSTDKDKFTESPSDLLSAEEVFNDNFEVAKCWS